jgi:ankyrin repeat protein
MSEKIHPRYRIKIESPCDADWDSMRGNDRIRFCEHCNLHVNNLSKMSRSQVMRLVKESNGRLCVRFTLPVKPRPAAQEKLYSIGKRASRIAAGAFTASLSIASAAAQAPSPSSAPSTLDTARVVRSLVVASEINPETAGEISGVISDPSGALVPNARLTLVNGSEHMSYTTSTDTSGRYFFTFLKSGKYSMSIDGGGFQQKEIDELDLSIKETRQLDLRLELPLVLAQVDIVAAPFELQEGATSGGMVMITSSEPLVRAAADNDLAVVKQLLFTTSNVNVRDEGTDTSALDHAVENGNYEMVQVLLAAGASVNTKDKSSRSPLMRLSDSATPELVRVLLAAGAKINARDDSHETPLMNAVSDSGVEVVRLLVESGARVDRKSDEGKTVLIFAAENDSPEVTKYLLSLGAELEATNDEGETALLVAASNGNSHVVKVLLEAGANVNAADHYGSTPLLNAIRSEKVESARLLLDAGADVTTRTRDGESISSLTKKIAFAPMLSLLQSRGLLE